MFVSGMLAELVEKLRAIPEGNGSMLDNTVVFMVAEMGYNHEVNGLPEVLIGGKNLGIKTGQYIRTGEAQSGKGMPINRLLVSLLKAMGVPGDSWGIQDPGKGPVPGLFRG
jgi:hypothetical protein